jgi:hypothetical protein
MRDQVTRAMQVQSNERKKLEAVLEAAHKAEQQAVIQTGGLPADSTDPSMLYDLTLGTIFHNETVANAYANVAIQVGLVAQASLDVAKAVASELPEMAQEQRDALQRAVEIVAKLRGQGPIPQPRASA